MLVEGRPQWFYEPGDPVQVSSINRLRRRLLIADEDGNMLEVSDQFPAAELYTREVLRATAILKEPVFERRTNVRGREFLVRKGPFTHANTLLVLALAHPLEGIHRETRTVLNWYFRLLPVMLALVGAGAWHMAGISLLPLRQLNQAAEAVSGETLSLRIAPRGANDEVDALTVQFNAMLDRLEQSFDRVKRFTIDASHELRTPITAIRGQLEVALITARTPQDYRAAIETAMEDVERLSKIVRSLLLLSQSESGQVTLQTQTIDLSKAVKDIAANFELPASANNIKFDVVVPDACLIQIDPIQFGRMMMNLLSNAFIYSRPGDSVTVTLSRLEREAVLTVTDTGPGIAAKHLPYIFDRFYRIREDAGPDKGIGLGLSFVQWIARAHGGRVEVKSAPNQGASFIVTLPVAEQQGHLRVLPID
jgi:heavy metal sensor kinase